MSDDQVFLEGIEVYAFGGVTEAERTVGQRYSIDVGVTCDLTAAGTTDDLSQTVSYADLHALVVAVMGAGPFNLVESRAHLIAEEILRTNPVTDVEVRIRKVAPPLPGVVAAAGVVVRRSRG